MLAGLLVWIPIQAEAQPDPRGSFLRSLAVPGWGHYYNDSDNWLRGQVHLGAELVLIGSYFGFTARAGNLEDQYLTFANHKAGVAIHDRSRAFRLALGQHDNLAEYNDFQLRSRNWDQLFADSPENRWEWKTPEDRQRYQELREKSDNARNQLPAIAALMVVNRAVSAVSAYRRARNMASSPELVFTPVHPIGSGDTGIVANLSFRF
ncbi:hypothetical protein DYD21_12250 [Rhodohalobacter sp. SW132]|nr:hypothetical protein DYD21_12250 [Rhodohalobacter sp. SW132]